MRKNFGKIIVEHPDFQYERKDMIGSLWKSCFYKQIEDFRKTIKINKMKYEEALKGPRGQGLLEFRKYLTTLSNEFSLFLKDSIVYFQKLMNEVKDKIMITIFCNIFLTD
jgi:hypothetical protein